MWHTPLPFVAVINKTFFCPMLLRVTLGGIRWAKWRHEGVQFGVKSFPLWLLLGLKLLLVFVQVWAQIYCRSAACGKKTGFPKTHSIRRILFRVVKKRRPRTLCESHRLPVCPRHRSGQYL